MPHCPLQALSINRSLSRAKLAAEKGQTNCRELRDLVIQAIEEAGGRIDYAEVRQEKPSSKIVLSWPGSDVLQTKFPSYPSLH